MPAPLPVDDVLPELLAALGRGPNVVLTAPTGAGKTTRVPPALVDAGLGGVVVLEPRRVAARAAAARVAFERNGPLGGEVGYEVRFERRVSARTRLRFVTEGVFLRQLQDDPFLEGVGCVVLDEFHERSLEADLALALARRVQQEGRADLRLVVMSATLESERVAEFLGGAPVVASEGRLHPIETLHLPALGREPLGAHVRRGVELARERDRGDALVFLPGRGEIRQARTALEPLARRDGLELLELYGDLPLERQDAVLRAGARRKLVLATNVAETSVTIEGVTAVVDTGLARTLRYDARVGLDRLELGPISRASAEQRRGRAGRTAPGVCVRLWSELEERALRERDPPAIARVDLAGAALELFAFGEADPGAFPWFEPPPADALARARELLERLGALGSSGLTPLGRELAALPVPPRLARLLVEGARRGALVAAALAAALLAERDPFQRPDDLDAWRDAADSDVLERVRALLAFERSGATEHGALSLRPGAARSVLRAARQYERLAGRIAGSANAGGRADEALLHALHAAFSDRLARRREPGSPRAVLAGGRGVRLARESAVTEAELFVCVDLEAGGEEALVRQASAVERAWLDRARLCEELEVVFDERSGRVVGRKRTLYDGLALEEVEQPVTDPADVERILAEAAATRLERALPLADPEVTAFLARVRSLRAWRPELGLPAFEGDELVALLPTLVAGCRSLADLAARPLVPVLEATLDGAQRAALARDAPERLRVPSGSQIRLQYELGRPPILAARIQELFGLAATPRVGGGRVPVLLHLLAPNGRPQQVTEDLESFWNGAYHVVRKELRRRYPKHAWPEDPWNAPPERRPGRRPG